MERIIPIITLLLVSIPYVSAQETQVSITIQPASSITSNGEIVYPTQSESHRFDAGAGGTFDFMNADGSSVKIIFFVGTTQVALDFFIDSYDKSAIVASHPLPTGRDVAGGLIYNMRTFEDAAETMTFDNPFSMTVGYTDTNIGSLDEGSLNIYFWNGSRNAWETFATSTLNMADNTITILSDHLTLFAVLGEIKETPQAAVVAGGGGIVGHGGAILLRQPEGLKMEEQVPLPVAAAGISAVGTFEGSIVSRIKKPQRINAPIPVARADDTEESPGSADLEDERIPSQLLDIGLQLEGGSSPKDRYGDALVIGVGIFGVIIVSVVYRALKNRPVA